MQNNSLKEKLSRGETVVGCDVTFYSPMVVEMMGVSGFDYVMINCEYGPLTEWQVEHLCQVAELRGMTPLVRVPAEGSLDHCRRMLDRGAMGIMMPHVRTAEYAEEFVRACMYMPDGHRSQCSRLRTNDFGRLSPQEYSSMANREIMCIALCENREVIDNIESIAAVDGIDVVYLGPGDLSADLGWPEPAEMDAHVARLRRAILSAGKVAGFVTRHAGVEAIKADGYRFIEAITHDLLQGSYQQFLAQAKGA